MARYINAPRKTLLRIKQNANGYRKLHGLAISMVAQLTGNADFPTPSPALATVTTAADALRDAMALLGQKRNRGSKSDFADCNQKAQALKTLLGSLISYVQNTAYDNEPNDTRAAGTQLSTSGAGLKLQPRKTKAVLTAVRNLHQVNNKNFPMTSNRLSWSRPTGLIKGKRADSYQVVDVDADVVIATTTATNCTVPASGQVKARIGVIPVSPAGKGVINVTTMFLSPSL